jgi:hypothetical protein
MLFFWVVTLCRASALKMEILCFSKTLASTYESTRRHNPEECRYLHRRENLKSLINADCPVVPGTVVHLLLNLTTVTIHDLTEQNSHSQHSAALLSIFPPVCKLSYSPKVIAILNLYFLYKFQ